jgi:hypothetical protein
MSIPSADQNEVERCIQEMRLFSEITTGFAPMGFTVILPKKYIEYPLFIPTDHFYTKRRGDLFLLKHKNGQFRSGN